MNSIGIFIIQNLLIRLSTFPLNINHVYYKKNTFCRVFLLYRTESTILNFSTSFTVTFMCFEKDLQINSYVNIKSFPTCTKLLYMRANTQPGQGLNFQRRKNNAPVNLHYLSNGTLISLYSGNRLKTISVYWNIICDTRERMLDDL